MNKEGSCCSLGFRFSFPRQSEVKCSRSSVCGNEGCWRAAWSPLSGASARLCSTLSSSSLRVVIRLLQWRGTLLSLFFFILSVEVFAFTCSVTIWGSEGKKHYGVNTLCGGSQSLCWGYYLTWVPPGRSHIQSQGDPQHNTQPIVCQPNCPYFPFNNSSTFNTNTRADKFWACVYLRVKCRKRYLQICSSTQ